jgi:hypothetical protein
MAFDSYLEETLGFGASSVQNRTEASHRSFAATFLYHSIFGSEPPYHPEWKAFFKGFSLPCRNGFNFYSVPKSFEGGSEAFFSLLWTSQIQGYDSLSPFLRFSGSSVAAALSPTLAEVRSRPVKDKITAFLQGSGIPCPTLFNDLKPTFSPLLDLSQADTPAFRSRMFAWAVTGSPFVDPDSETILVSIVDEADPLYSLNRETNRTLMLQGVICFKTCSRNVRLPAPYIARLAEQQYPPEEATEPRDFTEAFEHWMLCQILEVIGSHTTL